MMRAARWASSVAGPHGIVVDQMVRRNSKVGLTRTRALEARPGAQRAHAGPACACLVILAGGQIGKRIELDRRLIVGRDPACDLPLDSDLVSRSHACFEANGETIYVKDLQSTNGTYVNDRPTSEAQLLDGDRIALGEFVLKYLAPGNVEARYHDEVFRLMSHDGLTDVFNKRYHDEQLATLCGAEELLSLVLFDADHFKRVNDNHGHAAGDSVLRQLAVLARNAADGVNGAVVSRIGGEEFGILLPGCTLNDAKDLGERLRASVERHRFEFSGEQLRVTISVGVACRGAESVDPPETLYRSADAQLYRAKGDGRNRVCG